MATKTESNRKGSQSQDKLIRLNVGGQLFTTSLGTMKKYPDSLLGKMFTQDGISTAITDDEGNYFIDRDGTLFKYIINFMRIGGLNLPTNFADSEQLRADADFFGLEEIVKIVDSLDIDLIVGGRHFTTSLKTLNRYPQSKLSKMFTKKDGAGRFIIDRDGTLFQYILNFLRCKKLHLPKNFGDMEQLQAEVDFYGLTEMTQALKDYRPTPNGRETMWIIITRYTIRQYGTKGHPESLLIYCTRATFYSIPFSNQQKSKFAGGDYNALKLFSHMNDNKSVVNIEVKYDAIRFLDTITKAGFTYKGVLTAKYRTMIYERELV